MAFGRDGLFWTRPERRASLPLGREGGGDEDFPNSQSHQIRWATWRPHRFWGPVCEGEGRVTMQTIFRAHDQLRLNYRCKPDGWIEIELLDKIPRLALPASVTGTGMPDPPRASGNRPASPPTGPTAAHPRTTDTPIRPWPTAFGIHILLSR
jgi:hypothetical protein